MTPKQRVSQAMAQTLHVSSATAHELRAWWLWATAPLVDGREGLSLNRFLAILAGLAATHGRFAHEAPLTGWDTAFMTISGSLAFGKDVFVAFLLRKGKEELPV